MGKREKDLRKYPRSEGGFVGVEDPARPGVLNHVDNISCSGVLCQTVEPVPIMTKMRVVLELPEPFDQRLEAEGVVVRCDRDAEDGDVFSIAILYQHLDDESYELIKEYVEYDLAEKGQAES